MNSHSFVLVLSLFTAMGTSACFDKKAVIKPRVPSSSTSGSSSTEFTGATSAQNLSTDGLSIQVTWAAAKSPYVTYTVYSVATDGSLIPARTKIPLNQSSFTQSGLTSGNVYSYVVRAVKSDGTDDGNFNVASAFAYSGIKTVGGATGVGLNSAFLHFTAVGTKAQGFRITCTNPNQAVVATVSIYDTSAITHQMTGLYSGTTYSCVVNAIFPSFLGGGTSTDSNATSFNFQTISLGYSQTPPAYKGVMLVQAFGDAPTAPVASTAPAAIPSPVPVLSQRQVNITWNAFSGVDPWTSQYRLIRVRQGGILNMNSTTVCTPSQVNSCQVCLSLPNNSPLTRTCSDTVTTLGASPNRYDYAVSLIVNPTSTPPLAEEMPSLSSDAPFRILVPVPPDNMVLVHRDSVNYEICSYMGLTTDPLNNQRCSYTGLGSIPYSTNAFSSSMPLTLKGNAGTPFAGVTNAGTYYDFGYNLFVDRWETGCNWTPSAATTAGGTGMCGAGATSGDCFGSGPPLASVGVNGNVFFDHFAGQCYAKYNGTWSVTYNLSGTPYSFQTTMMTNVPNTAVQKPPAHAANNFVCAAQVNPNYGPKRIPSRREFVAAAAFPWLPGEPNQYGSFACNTFNHSGVAVPAAMNVNQAFPVGNGIGNYKLMIGSHYTASCASRYGAQDMVGNTGEYTSDVWNCVAGTRSCIGISKDLTFTRQYNFDGVGSNTGPGGTGHGQVAPNYTYFEYNISQQLWGTSYFSIPMGLPFVSDDNGNAILTSNLKPGDAVGQFHVISESVGYKAYYAGGSFYTGYGGNSRFSMVGGGNWHNDGFRCVLPAE